MNRSKSLTLVALLVAALPAGVAAQTPDPIEIWIPDSELIQELELQDGSKLLGRVSDDGDPVRFVLLSGATVEVRRSQIASLKTAEGLVKNGQLWRPDPSSNRMFFGPTGRTIDKGEGYFAVFELFFPAVGIGVTDRFSIAGGTLLLGVADGARPVWLIPKLQVVDREGFDFSVGALAITVFGDDFGTVGVLFGSGTFGNEEASLTTGAGWGWVDDDLASTPALLLGADARVSRNLKLMTENYWLPTGESEDAVLVSAGVRFLGERLSADVALAVAPGSDGAFFPLVNFVWNW